MKKKLWLGEKEVVGGEGDEEGMCKREGNTRQNEKMLIIEGGDEIS
jgi:hypothetical protein